jgi:hypothetical protein
MGADGSAFAAKMTEVKNLVLGVSLVAAGAWCLHGVIDRARAPQPGEKQIGEIVVARAPDGSLRERWQSPTPVPVASKQLQAHAP